MDEKNDSGMVSSDEFIPRTRPKPVHILPTEA